MSDKPTIDFNLDTFERENAPEPFSVVLGGKRYTLLDAQEVDYRDLLRAQEQFANGNPQEAIEQIVPADDRKEFFANPLPSFKLGELFNRYNEHYGISNQGEASASSAS